MTSTEHLSELPVFADRLDLIAEVDRLGTLATEWGDRAAAADEGTARCRFYETASERASQRAQAIADAHARRGLKLWESHTV